MACAQPPTFTGGPQSGPLGFEDQETLGVSMGYGDERAVAAERLMQAFYLYARTVTRARSGLFERLRPRRRRTRPMPTTDLGGGVRLFDGQVTVAEAAEVQRDPALAMRALRPAQLACADSALCA